MSAKCLAPFFAEVHTFSEYQSFIKQFWKDLWPLKSKANSLKTMIDETDEPGKRNEQKTGWKCC